MMTNNAKEELEAYNAIIIKAVKYNDFSGIIKECIKRGVIIPANKRIFKGGIYKAAYENETLPADIRMLAKKNCIALGFKPEISIEVKKAILERNLKG